MKKISAIEDSTLSEITFGVFVYFVSVLNLLQVFDHRTEATSVDRSDHNLSACRNVPFSHLDENVLSYRSISSLLVRILEDR